MTQPSQPPEPDDTIYTQSCEFYRYQDRLMWSRFQTIALIEGAVLYGVYTDIVSAGLWERFWFAIFGFVLIVFLTILSVKDLKDANSYLPAIRAYEKVHNPSYTVAPWPKWLKGVQIVRYASTLIIIFTIFVVFHSFCRACRS